MKVLVIGNDARAYSMVRNMFVHGHSIDVVGNHEYLKDAGAENLYATLAEVPEDMIPAYNLIISCSYEVSESGELDKIRSQNAHVLGASEESIRLEASKNYGLTMVATHSVPVAPFEYITDTRSVCGLIEDGYTVVKRDGFAAGRGVVVCESPAEVQRQVQRFLTNDGGVLLQKKIVGTPVCIVWMQTAGEPCPLCLQIDYKRTYTGDLGPFCGAMGAVVQLGVPDSIVKRFIEPLSGMLKRLGHIGRVGLDCMCTDAGELYAIEWTARFGTPTTEAMLAAWGVGVDIAHRFYAWLDSGGTETVGKDEYPFGVSVAIAGGGYPYPDAVQQGLPIKLATELPDGVLPNAASGRMSDLRTAGGRHMIVAAGGASMKAAQMNAYTNVRKVQFTDMFYRTDIGRGAGVLARLQ